MGTDRSKFKEQAIKLRFEGKSYNEIITLLKIPSKGTLSYWFKNLVLPVSTQEQLKKNIQLAHDRGLFKFNAKRTARILEENSEAHNVGESMIGNLSPRELLLIGTALYWGEGTKIKNEQSSESLAFTNSDPDMIAVYMHFLRNVLLIKEERIKAGIHLYKDTNIEESREYWSKITKLPPERFYIIEQVSRASAGKRISKLQYGTVVVKVNNRLVSYKMKGMISGLINASI